MPKHAVTTLTVEIRYDPKVTDPESLASAMDRLMETALSTPGLLDEYGDPVIGEFYVLAEDDKQRTQFSVEGASVSGMLVAAERAKYVKTYSMVLDGPLFRRQRRLLMDLAHEFEGHGERAELLEGLITLTDAIADQAHDNHGIDCLLAPDGEQGQDDDVCDCQRPGYFCSGVTGILAHMEDGRVAPGTEVERCDQCGRYPSDQAAVDELRRLGKI
jgi:hypothetical protein